MPLVECVQVTKYLVHAIEIILKYQLLFLEHFEN